MRGIVVPDGLIVIVALGEVIVAIGVPVVQALEEVASQALSSLQLRVEGVRRLP